MRCNQVSIFLERFGEYVPKNYPGDVQRIHVYVDDSTSIYTALSKAYAMTINELAEYEQIGVRADVSTNEFAGADYKKMHGVIPKYKRTYDEDMELEYGDTHYELCKDYMWMFEHAAEIVELIKNSKDQVNMIIALKNKYNLSDYQVRKLSQIRLDMLTKEKYEECIAYMKKREEWEERKATANLEIYNEATYKLYIRQKMKEIKTQIAELEAYFVVAEHYPNIIRLMQESESPHDFTKAMEENFGFTGYQSDCFKYMTIKDFGKTEREEKERKLEGLKKDLQSYKEEIESFS